MIRALGFSVLALSIFFGSLPQTWAQDESMGSPLPMQQGTVSTGTETPTEDLALPAERRPLVPLTEQDQQSRKYSPFSFSYFNWATVNAKNYREGEGQISTYNFVSVDYRLNYDSKVSFRPVFFISSAGKDFFGEQADAEVALGDAYLQYFHYNLALLPGDIGLLGAFRVYLPLSDASKENKLLTRVQARLLFTRQMTRSIELAYHLYPGYYVVAQRGTLNNFGAAKGNKQADLEQYIELSERVSTQLGFSQRVGFTHEWKYDVPSQNIASKRDEFLNVSLMASYSLGPVNFRAGLINDIKLREFSASAKAKQKPLKLGREEELQYSLMTSVRF
ncbi:MAG: hypothetical protein IT288_04705 [Bdellovibrionales bacterium]|nr:hypothetical protein [Bdellovibrionales bacterium]